MQPLQSHLVILSSNPLLAQKLHAILTLKYGDPLDIDTKYYRCRVIVKTLAYDQLDQLSAIKQVEGIFFVVDAATLEGHDSFLERADEIISSHAPNLQAVLYHRLRNSQINQALIEKGLEALDQFIETIYLDLDEDPKKIVDQDGNEEAAEGLARVYEVLECNQWKNMQHKEKKAQKKNAELEQAADGKESEEQFGENFADLLANISQLRQDNSISHEERKAKAEELIMRLMRDCQIDDGDESD